MAREVPEIDRLIEEGLTLYGQGDLDEALLRWEKALAIDPDNPQATSYVDYVRANYELLTVDRDGEATSEGAPFGIADDEPEYQIEIQPGEIKPSTVLPSSPEFIDPQDEGWFIDDETVRQERGDGVRGPPSIDRPRRPSQEMTLELEADEPPRPEPPKRASSSPGVDFDDATREYDKRKQSVPPDRRASTGADEFGPDGTPGFGHPNDFQTPPGFGTQATGVKTRDLGFVQPAGIRPPMTATELGLPERPRPPAKTELPATPSSLDELTLEPSNRAGDTPTQQHAPLTASDLDDLDLISSLPSPRPAPQVKQITIDTPLSGAAQQQPKVTTRDFPHQTRAPAIPAAKTKDLSPLDLSAPSLGSAPTVDFDSKTQERKQSLDRTQDIPNMAQVANLVVSAPTRDLGLRDAAPKPAPARRPEAGDATRADVVLAFDPIDARASEIIEDVDEAAPRDEAREDKTRRRITTLFEKAARWTSEGDLERAVAAVDLALSEDPNAALAQKLIHRNRETIMSVFQAYLGDLQRTPQLARPLHELASAPISPRAAFLLSRIDGLLSIDEILDVCGMPRLEAYRYLCQLYLRGILR